MNESPEEKERERKKDIRKNATNNEQDIILLVHSLELDVCSVSFGLSHAMRTPCAPWSFAILLLYIL